MTSVAVICNPAKVEDVERLRNGVTERCGAIGAAAPLWLETTKEDPGVGMAHEALAAEADLILVCGGDGTVAACAGALANSDASMAIIPFGTGNLLARNLGIPLGIGDALTVAFGGQRRKIDVLEAGSNRFVVMAGLGFDAALIDSTDEDLKKRIGWLAYIGGARNALRTSRAVGIEIELDGRRHVHRRALGVLVGNVGKLQGGLTLLPKAEPDDGVLDVIVLRPRGLRGWFSLVRKGLRGGPPGGTGPETDVLRGRSVRIVASEMLTLEFDGDVAGQSTELRVEVLAGALALCCPEP
jgi:diacylglycerol kinase family enzyme